MAIRLLGLDALVGVALGTGYLTSLRFLGPAGVSELLFLFVIAILFKKNYTKLFSFHKTSEGFIKLYFLFSALIVMPAITLLVLQFGGIQKSDPVYIVSFAGGIVFYVLIIEAVRSNQINMSAVAMWSSAIFIVTNLISLFIFNLDVPEGRYTGGAKNPNQLLFYASTLSLLLVIYQKKASFILIPIIFFIVLKSKSDAYMLMLVVTLSSFIYLQATFFLMRTSIFVKLLTHVVILLGLTIYIVYAHGPFLMDAWLNADQGGKRIALMWNALLASIQSPVFGWGAGSFSGVYYPFSGSEAHNTFLDFSMSFGFLFPILIYTIIFSFLIKSIRQNNYLVAAFTLGFIVSGLFHFSGRHFTFWIELAVFSTYIFSGANNTFNLKDRIFKHYKSPIHKKLVGKLGRT